MGGLCNSVSKESEELVIEHAKRPNTDRIKLQFSGFDSEIQILTEPIKVTIKS